MTNSTKAKLLGGAVLVFLVLIIAFQNSGSVSIRVLFWGAYVDRVLLFVLLFLSGFVTGMLAQWGWRRRAAAARA